MKIRTIRDLDELQSVQSYWESAQNHPNTDFEHFKLVCKLRESGARPYVVVVEKQGCPCVLLTARLEDSCFAPSIGYFKPISIRAKVLTVLYQGIIGDIDQEIGEELVTYLQSQLASGQADALVFHLIPEQSPIASTLMDRSPQWFSEPQPQPAVHWEMLLPPSPIEGGFLQQKVRSKHRAWFRRKQRDLDEAFPGRIAWRWVTEFNDLMGLCERIERVAAQTYQRSLGAGFVNDDEHRQRFCLFAERGQLRVQLLEIDGQIQAFWIGTVYAGVFHSFETGYHPDLRKHEVGTLVFIRMVDRLIQEGIQKFDFGLGDAHYKQRFGDRSWKEVTVRIFAPTAKGIALRCTLALFASLDQLGRRVAHRAGVLDRLKTGWRRRLTSSEHDESKSALKEALSD